MRGTSGGRGSGPLLIYKNIGFVSNTGPDPRRNHKATKPAFNILPPLACQGNAIEIRACTILITLYRVVPLNKLQFMFIHVTELVQGISIASISVFM